MPDWLFEGHTSVYILLALALLVSLFIYWQWHRKVWLYVMLAVVSLIGLYALLDRLVETDREQIQRKLEEMAEGLRTHNADLVFKHFSDNFRSPLGKDMSALRRDAAGQINSVTQVIFWNYDFKTRPEAGKDYRDLRFSFKVTGVGVDNFPFDCQPVFEHNPAKGWQLKELKLFKYGTTEDLGAHF